MEYFPWKDRYSVGIKEIDDQHKKLVAILNELYQAMQDNRGKQVLTTVLASLTKYIQTHFITEENLMEKHGYPDLDNHKKSHVEFADKIKDYEKQFQEGNYGLSVQLSFFLKDWLKRHLLGTDKKYVPFLHSKGVK